MSSASTETRATPDAAAVPSESPKQQRLSINLNAEAAEFLRQMTEERGISYTEAIRRALAVYKFIEDQRGEGNSVQIDDGHKIRELVLL